MLKKHDGDESYVKSLDLSKYHAMKMYGGMEIQLHECLTSTLDGGEWLASALAASSPGMQLQWTKNVEEIKIK
jgi:hypothetical protein